MNKAERTYATIRSRILNGTYGPGYRLVLDTLARELGVSAVPVREAIRRLEAEGWVVYRRNAGAQVSPIDSLSWESAMQVLAVLEGHATALAAPHLSNEELSSLRDNNKQAVRALEDLDLMEFTRLNRSFHFGIYGTKCPNRYLVQLLEDTWDRLDTIRRTVFPSIPSRTWDSVREHEALLDMIERNEPFERIEAAARRHKMQTIEAYRSAHDRLHLTRD
jgi:DNA-binding GntR family transcriptional regulator